jgi:hypothetical protein
VGKLHLIFFFFKKQEGDSGWASFNKKIIKNKKREKKNSIRRLVPFKERERERERERKHSLINTTSS